MSLLQFLHPARRSFTGNSLYPNFITRDPVTPVGPATITDALLQLVFCNICSSSLSLSFESLDAILISNFHYYFQDGRPTRYYNHRYYKPYNIYDYNRRTLQDHRHHIYFGAKQYAGRKDIVSIIKTNCMHWHYNNMRRNRNNGIMETSPCKD